MRYKYRVNAESSKSIQAKQVAGLPADIDLKFSQAYLRFYKSEEDKGFFRCSLAIPAHQDDEGYVLELDFHDPIRAKQLDNPREPDAPSFASDFDCGGTNPFVYEVPLNDHDFSSIGKVATCKFSDEIKQGRRNLLFNLSIKGTPFHGYVLIDPELYQTNKLIQET